MGLIYLTAEVSYSQLSLAKKQARHFINLSTLDTKETKRKQMSQY